MGFSAVTRGLGHSLACAQGLSNAQTFYALKIVRIHRGQIGSLADDILTVAEQFTSKKAA